MQKLTGFWFCCATVVVIGLGVCIGVMRIVLLIVERVNAILDAALDKCFEGFE